LPTPTDKHITRMFSTTTLLVLLVSYPALIFGQGHATSDQISTSATQYDNLVSSLFWSSSSVSMR
jgi:hypothetical protein